MAANTEQIEPLNLRTRIHRISTLAAMPQVVLQLLDAMHDEKSSPASLEQILESDPALSSKILSLANSSYYGLRQKITTIRRAVVIIGFRELELLTLGSGLAEIFDITRMPQGFDGQELWLHCLAVSWIGRELALAARHDPPDEIMLAGLLHDLGKLILATQFQKEFSALLDLTRQDVPFYLAEKKMRLEHTQVGFMLAEKWGLPEVHATAIRDHHAPDRDNPHYQACCLVSLADQLAKNMQIGLVQESLMIDQAQLLAATPITRTQLADIKERAGTHLPKAVAAWMEMLTGRPNPY
jgi:putative nucleotidyltransferase with HDIG domain